MSSRWTLVASFLASSCSQDPVVVSGYDLTQPVVTLALPKSLREVSGIVAIGGTQIFALQDEDGALHRIDLENDKVVRIAFGKKGDYEGVAFDGVRYWVLRSDGKVLRLREDGDRFAVDEDRKVHGDESEYEGLCWDPVTRDLILAPKDLLPDKEDRDLRPLYRVDPDTLKQRDEPLVIISRDGVRAMADKLGLDLAKKLRLRWSEVAVHPRTGELWLLSAVDHALVVVARDGAVKGVHVFDSKALPQPEGLTFLADGRLAVASEGKPGVLCVFAAR